jgi:hypothetical protein
LSSLHATSYAGDVALLVYADDHRMRRSASLGFQALPVPHRRPWQAFLARVLRVALRRARALPLGSTALRALPLRAALRRRLDQWSACLVHEPAGVRYVHYETHLRAVRYDRVILSDVRDVVFQSDPSGIEPDARLVCFLESARYTIGTEPKNSRWMTELYGQATLERLADRRVSCSGVTIGSHDAMLDYVVALNDEMARVIGRVWDSGYDQGVHNQLLWSGAFPHARVMENGRGVFTVGQEPRDALALDASGRVCCGDGSVPAMVHQYDRHQDVADALRARHGVREAA